jgi:hypothetical protein
MKSIRLSLIVYFLLLLSAALGGISFLAFRTTAKAKQEKASIKRDLLEFQYNSQHREELLRLDTDLQSHARTLASLAQSQLEANRLFIQFSLFGSISSSAAPYGHLTTPIWLGESRSDPPRSDPPRSDSPRSEPMRFWMSRALATDMHFGEDSLHRDEDKNTDYFQVNSSRSLMFRSKSLGERSLPFDVDQFNLMQVYETEIDDIELDGIRLRRMIFKAPMFRGNRYRPSTVRMPDPPRPGARPGNVIAPNAPSVGRPDSRPPGPPRMNEPPTIFIQCASEVSHRDLALAALKTSFDEDLANLEVESHASLLELRRNLLWVSLATFAATIVGGFVLVSSGLSPLRRLNDAVSRVSENHLQLDYEGPSPPLELRPVIDGLTGIRSRKTVDRGHFARTAHPPRRSPSNAGSNAAEAAQLGGIPRSSRRMPRSGQTDDAVDRATADVDPNRFAVGSASH